MKTILAWAVPLMLWPAFTFAQGALTLTVTGFKTDRGYYKIWLFKSADGFPSDDKKALYCVETPINELI